MKLKLKLLNAKARTERVTLPANLVSMFDAYIAFYQGRLNIDVAAQQMIQEISISFIQSDREFMRHWRGEQLKDEAKKIK